MTKRPRIPQRERPEKLLVDRADTSAMLGDCSITMLERMETDGILTPRRLRPSANAKVFYAIEEVKAAAKGVSVPAEAGDE
jgi:hypothetical protein